MGIQEQWFQHWRPNHGGVTHVFPFQPAPSRAWRLYPVLRLVPAAGRLRIIKRAVNQRQINHPDKNPCTHSEEFSAAEYRPSTERLDDERSRANFGHASKDYRSFCCEERNTGPRSSVPVLWSHLRPLWYRKLMHICNSLMSHLSVDRATTHGWSWVAVVTTMITTFNWPSGLFIAICYVNYQTQRYIGLEYLCWQCWLYNTICQLHFIFYIWCKYIWKYIEQNGHSRTKTHIIL